MSDVAIRCEPLSKQYRIGERELYKALRDVITDAATSPFRRLRSALSHNGSANSDGSKIRNPKSEIRNSADGTSPSALSPLPATDSSLITSKYDLGPRRRFFRSQARQSSRHHRTQRSREEHTAQDSFAHYQTYKR